MGNFINLQGESFGRLTVETRSNNSKNGSVRWKCRCSCGGKTIVRAGDLRNGSVKSCGCLRKEISTLRATTHNMSDSLAYGSWFNMIVRCVNKNNARYKDYGGRGITVCKKWMVFEGFFADMGERPKGLTLERVDNNGNYEPSNCKWATPSEQQRNKKVCHNSKTGVIGVHLYNRMNKYVAKIFVNGRPVHLGYFARLGDAIAARKEGELKYWGKAKLVQAFED